MLDIELFVGDVAGDLCSSSWIGGSSCISLGVSSIGSSLLLIGGVSSGSSTIGTSGWFAVWSSIRSTTGESAFVVLSNVVVSRKTTSICRIGGCIGKSSAELLSRVVLSWFGWFQILFTILSSLGVSFITPWGRLCTGWEYEHDGWFACVDSLLSFMKSLGSEEVTIANGGVLGDSVSILWILKVGENFSFALLTDVKLLLSEELEYFSLRLHFWFPRLLQCRGFRFLIKYARAGGLREACFGVFDPLGSLGAPWGFVRRCLWAYLFMCLLA